jgi:hypothetical protein
MTTFYFYFGNNNDQAGSWIRIGTTKQGLRLRGSGTGAERNIC